MYWAWPHVSLTVTTNVTACAPEAKYTRARLAGGVA